MFRFIIEAFYFWIDIITATSRAKITYREQAFSVLAHVTEFSMRIANVDEKRNLFRAILLESLAVETSYRTFAVIISRN